MIVLTWLSLWMEAENLVSCRIAWRYDVRLSICGAGVVIVFAHEVEFLSSRLMLLSVINCCQWSIHCCSCQCSLLSIWIWSIQIIVFGRFDSCGSSCKALVKESKAHETESKAHVTESSASVPASASPSLLCGTIPIVFKLALLCKAATVNQQLV